MHERRSARIRARVKHGWLLWSWALFSCQGNVESAARDAGEQREPDPPSSDEDGQGPVDSDAGGAIGTRDAGGAGGATSGGSDAGGGAGGTQGLPSGSLLERIGTTDVTIPAGVKPGVRNWRIFGQQMLKVAPLFTVPLANCGTLIGFTTGTAMAPNARAVRLDAHDKVVASVDLGALLELRGLAAEPDGHFAALLWSGSGKQIWVKRYDLAGKEQFSTELKNDDNSPTDFGIGEARLEFGNGKYGAYYHVHSDSGHEGDTLKFVAAQTGVESTTWGWGCSHSMSNLLTFQPTGNAFLASCVTDCYPGTSGTNFATTAKGGVYTENRNKLLDVAGGCNGDVAGELGGASAASAGWKLVFNAHQEPTVLGQKTYNTMTMNQDIAFASIGANKQIAGAVVWLTSTPKLNEADAALARFRPMGDDKEQYVVGWQAGGAYTLARIDGAGALLEQPSDVSAKAKWGQRDDPFRTHTNGDIVWSWADAANSTTLKFARLRSGGTAQCADF